MNPANEKPWPTHADGRPKRMGELSPNERREQLTQACAKLKRELESPAMRRALADALKEPGK